MSTSFLTCLAPPFLVTPGAPGVHLLWILQPHPSLPYFWQSVNPNCFFPFSPTSRRHIDFLPLAWPRVAGLYLIGSTWLAYCQLGATDWLSSQSYLNP